MKRVFAALFCICMVFTAFTQTITGYVSDEKTGKGINDALVCFDGTMYGIRTDMNGYFNIDISAYRTRPLSVCSAGYYTVTFDIETPGKPVQIYMNPMIYSSTVNNSIITNEESRKECIKLFKGTFLGKTRNALACEISNEDDLKFVIIDSVQLLAFTSAPLQIINNALGFQILYYLDQFELTLKDESFSFSGIAFFSADLAEDYSNEKALKKKREQAYLGSRMYFFRTLWENELEKEGIILKNAQDNELDYEKIVINKGDAGKYLKHFERVKQFELEDTSSVIYVVFRSRLRFYNTMERMDSYDVTKITIHDDIYFDRTGYFDPTAITWRGNLANQRIADLLPFDYKYE